ncbi:MAG: hypothetical protein Ct9H300mP4_02320 [Gammaproteobacteria bacterium]|nr:MAG: hypothetical protein Ct9H300mP4_02320 [Gammaproteobacteria bacterium]
MFSFSYDKGTEKMPLVILILLSKPGETVAIVGKSGSGKNNLGQSSPTIL